MRDLKEMGERLCPAEAQRRRDGLDGGEKINRITGDVLDAAIKVHKLFGPGLLESVATMHPVFPKQLRTYLVLTGKRIGLLINFGLETLKSGFVRVINSHLPDVSVRGKDHLRFVTDLDLSRNVDLSASAPQRETFQPTKGR